MLKKGGGDNKVKKIVLIIPNDFPNGEKNNARIKAIGENLQSLSWEVTYVSLMPTRFVKNADARQPSSWKNATVVHILNWTSFPKYFPIRMAQIIACQLGFLVYLIRNSRSFDVLYFYTPQWLGTLSGLVLSKTLGHKIVVDQTDLHSAYRFSWWHKSEEFIVGRLPDLLLTISSFLYSHFHNFKKTGVEKFSILVDLDRFKLEINNEKHVLGYVGSFADKDGIQLMLEAVSIARSIYPDIRLRLIGRDPFPLKTESLIIEYSLEEIVERTGSVDYMDIPKLLLECDTFIMNRNSSQFAETGYPIKLGEYFACNRPVLMSDGPGYSEDFTHLQEAIKYKVDDAQALADAIVFRYENDTLAREVSQRGYEYAVAHFDSKKQVKKLVKILNEL